MFNKLLWKIVQINKIMKKTDTEYLFHLIFVSSDESTKKKVFPRNKNYFLTKFIKVLKFFFPNIFNATFLTHNYFYILKKEKKMPIHCQDKTWQRKYEILIKTMLLQVKSVICARRRSFTSTRQMVHKSHLQKITS